MIIDSDIQLTNAEKKLYLKTEKLIGNDINSKKVVLYTKPNNQFLLVSEDELKVDQRFTSQIAESLLNINSYLYGLNDDVVLGYNKGDEYIVQYQNKFVKWEITNESKEILGFTCFKAIPTYNQKYGEREVNSYAKAAWFTPAINKRGGPLRYSNLPGLILQVESPYATITAVNIKEITENKAVPQIDKKIITELQAYERVQAMGNAIKSRMRN